MTTLCMVLLALSLFGVLSPLSPVKLSASLIVLSLVLFMQIFLMNSMIWMSSIFFMIFIGGIMVMFMILSSLMPNEKNMKTKSNKLSYILILFVISESLAASTQEANGFMQETKFIFLSNQTYEILMMVILLYFLFFIFIISKQTSSMRSFLC